MLLKVLCSHSLAGDTKQDTITMEGKGGNIIILLEAVEYLEFKVKGIAEKFEEREKSFSYFVLDGIYAASVFGETRTAALGSSY